MAYRKRVNRPEPASAPEPAISEPEAKPRLVRKRSGAPLPAPDSERSRAAVERAREALAPVLKPRARSKPAKLGCGCFNCTAGKTPCLMTKYK